MRPIGPPQRKLGQVALSVRLVCVAVLASVARNASEGIQEFCSNHAGSAGALFLEYGEYSVLIADIVTAKNASALVLLKMSCQLGMFNVAEREHASEVISLLGRRGLFLIEQ